MINIYPAINKYSADHGWLRSSFSFSFADYYDPANQHFGVMRVLNDDAIAGHKGFGMHPHKEMEIVSVVLKGKLQHQDSMGHTAVTQFGEIQRMTAGTGVMHSEINPTSEETHLLQMWFFPEERGLAPSYETSSFDVNAMHDALLPIVSKQSGAGVAHIHQDMTIYLSDLESGKEICFTQPEGRKIFLFVLESSYAE